MNSLRTVEKGGFNWLMDGLIGNLKLIKRTFFTQKLKKDYSNTKTALCMALEKATDICTTTDMWTSHRRSCLGMTAHWKGEDLKRRLFSTAGLIFTSKRCKLSDFNFNMLLFFKLNGSCCREWNKNPSKRLITPLNNAVYCCAISYKIQTEIQW